MTETNATADNDAAPSEPATAQLVILDWNDLIAAGGFDDSSSSSSPNGNSIAQALDEAFGANGAGIVGIRNVPGFVRAKQAFLPMAHKLANLPAEYLEENLTDPKSLYNAGWSHGKEKLGNKPDTAKGSYYYNPVTDLPGSAEDRANYPLSYPQNVWPDESKLPGFKTAACDIGDILKLAVVELTRHLDALAHARNNSYPAGFLYDAMKDTDKVKARLLYYFPLEEPPAENMAQKASVPPAQDSWIGWHGDSGFLTALAGDLYVRHDTGQVLEVSPDPAAGLYAATRTKGVVKVDIPFDCLAVQMGECTQIATGGVFSATPHCVRGIQRHEARSPPIARISLPCFVDTPPTFPLSMPQGCKRETVLGAAVPSPHVPPLEQRWTQDGMTFGDFLQQTFSLYYDWSTKGGKT